MNALFEKAIVFLHREGWRGHTPTTLYDDANAIWFSNAPRDDATIITLTAGQLAVFFPSDAHAPMHSADKPTRVRKIVVKVAV